ncbi:MAG: mechanosensitive ion channel family protein [Akkermansiaceae bacterium]|nr:mechanosensitive ion channel family protein [Akkermansiaceae bacterium]
MTKQEVADNALAVWSYLIDGGWVMFVIYVVAGWVIARIVRRLFLKLSRSERRLPIQIGRFLSKFVVAVIWALAGVQALRAVGVDLVGILGAAGVAGVAIGFASQTSLSNLISGVFLVTERSLSIGDYVKTSGLEGTVESINLLSIYLRQADNALIRIPCESIIKNPVVNYTRKNIRRCDYEVGVDYSTDISRVQEVVDRVVQRLDLLPDAPAPVVQFIGFGDSSLDVRIGVWCAALDYHHTRYVFAKALMDAFHEAGISIPFPIRDVRMTQS